METLIEDCLTYDPDTGLFKWVNPGGSGVFKQGWFAGTIDNSYAHIRVNRKKYKAHRLAWFLMKGEWPKNQIDHIDGNRSNNKFNNLRDVTPSVNMQNMKKPNGLNTLGYLGVHFDNARQKYTARLTLNGKKEFLGRFETAEEAYEAYLQAKRLRHEGNTL